MSIQFRARTISTTVEVHTPPISGDSSTGWCCGGGKDALSSKPECDAAGGYFLSGQTNRDACPSCIAGFAPNFGTLGSCCHYEKQSGFYTLFCADVYSDFDCSDLHQGKEEGLRYQFNPNDTCQGSTAGNSVCEVSSTPFGNCCTQNTDGTVDCSITFQSKCSGFWSYPVNGILSCVDSTPCSGVYFTSIAGITPRASLTTLQNSTNYIQTLPTTPQIYQGGLYVGIFKPGSPINPKGVTLYGSPYTGNANQYVSRGNGIGTSEKSWILIAATKDYFSLPMNSESLAGSTMSTSIYDGLLNTYGTESSKANVYSSLDTYTLNGFNDWYLPSQEELAFYFQNVKYGFALDKQYTKLTEGPYMTSTVYDNGIQNFNNTYFVYSQNAAQFTYGNVNLVSRNIPLNIRLFRRIYLDS